jgi:hypothetical protein
MPRSRAGTDGRSRSWRYVSEFCMLMAHPLRYALVVELTSAPLGSRFLCRRLKLTPRRLHHHLKRLSEGGIVKQNGSASKGTFRLGPRARAVRVGNATRLVLSGPDGSCLELLIKRKASQVPLAAQKSWRSR